MLKPQTETLSFLLIVVLELLTKTESIPVDLQDAMKKAKSLETFLALLNVSAEGESLKNDVAEVPVVIANELCKPVEVMVQIPQPRRKRALVFPVYVKLFRCRGGCNIEPRLSECAPTEQEQIPIKVGFVTWKKGENTIIPGRNKLKIIHLMNDTQCGCHCIKVRKCNPWTQIWNKNSCRCDYIYNYCPPPLKWNNISRECECPQSNVCHGPGKVWSPEECQCVCHDPLSCSLGHYMNPNTCRCTCYKSWCTHTAVEKTPKQFDKDTIELAKSQTQAL